ncbi:thiol-activated cytolysin family protein [Niabella beijingensis]|uniref:thiol-activated cytolysin family protein n=1 Tax=Niabella beijingensis TaxID=2872700 RepID=UPI001CC10E05|nr:thiol-activated cytolysin family protein [Niabella beijingensis]MBZ4189364.1 thiol-activated cytolysin family protein [Niabella beijingensis]
MNRIVRATMLLLLIYCVGCTKRDIAEVPENVKSGKPGWYANLKKADLKSFSITTPKYSDPNDANGLLGRRKRNGDPGDGPDPIMGTYPTGPGIIFHPINGGNEDPNAIMYRQSFKSNVFVVEDQAMSLNIFPGAILNGRSISSTAFSPAMLTGISGNIRPINISTSLPVSSGAVARTYMARPSNDRAFVRTALTDLENLNPGRVGAARLQVEKDSFNVYEELKTLYGYNKNIDIFIASGGSSSQNGSHDIQGNAGIKIKFFQQNFTIDVDVPSDYSELFDPTGLDTSSVFGGYSPYYVSSVTYGRMGIMTIESSTDASTLYSIVNKQINILGGVVGGGTQLTQQEKDILNNADIKVRLTGIGVSADRPIVVNGLQGFIETLSANATYSKDDPGIPISFRLRYLVDDTNVEAPFDINYGPFDKPYVKMHNGSYSEQTGNPFYRRADLFVSFFKDRLGASPYTGVPNFLSVKYEKVVNTTSYNNYLPSYSHRTEGPYEFYNKLKSSIYYIGNFTFYYHAIYGSEANSTKDEIYYQLIPSDYYSIIP